MNEYQDQSELGEELPPDGQLEGQAADAAPTFEDVLAAQIGRASCRERVSSVV